MASAIAVTLARSGHSWGWLAEGAGIDRDALESRLRGDDDFTMVDLAKIAAALGVPVASLTPSDGRTESDGR